jgi:flagellar basal-body rod protein FlgG
VNPGTQGIYAAAAGMAAQQAWMDAISNDVANLQTDGYKQERVGFRELVDGAGAAPVDSGRSFRQGTLVQSDDPLAVAINGPGFFQVKGPGGQTALTRGGVFHVDATGSIVTASGAELVPPIRLPKGVSPDQVKIDADGTVHAQGTKLGKLAIVDVPAPQALQSAGDGLFVPTTASGRPTAVATSTVQQSFVEASNVDTATAMTDLLQAQRAYQLQSRVLQFQDQMLEIANGIRR